MTRIEIEQRELCKLHKVEYYPSFVFQKLGISKCMNLNIRPMNGLRHIPSNGTCGWYIWSGEQMSQDENYFEPIHLLHIYELFPNLLKFFGLPPGWRFLVAPDYEDVWYDPSLLVE